MGKKVKTGKSRRDKFYQLAKETGFRSRASFKLIQLNRRFNFLGQSKVLIDLCAAPGSWLQVAVREMPVSSKIIGVDLVPIQAIPRVKTFTADITTDKCRILLKNELNGMKADIVLNDGAPNVGTAWSIDEFNQAQLCLKAFSLATDFLRKGGWFVTKVFRSRDYEPLKWVLSQFFKTVKSVKPEASRLESAEIFIVAQNYLAPDKIDPKFLDPKHVFVEVEQPQDRNEIVARLMKHSLKRKALGYDEGDQLYKEVPVMEFINSEDPLVALASINKIILDIPEIANHPATTDAIKILLDDIRVLGKGEIKSLLKWHKKIVEAIKAGEELTKPVVEKEVKEPTEEDLEEQLEAQIADALDEERKELKKKLKKARETRKKLAERIVNKMHHQGDVIEHNDDFELFNLRSIDNLSKLYETGKLIGDTSVTGIDDKTRKDQTEREEEEEAREKQVEQHAVEGLKQIQFTKRGPERTDDHLQHLGTNESYDPDNIFAESDEESEGENSYCPTASEDESESDSEKEELSPELAAKRDRMLGLMNKKYSKDKKSGQEEPQAKKAKPFNILLDLDDQEELVKKKNAVKKWCNTNELKHLMGHDEGAGLDSEEELFQDFDSADEDEVPADEPVANKASKRVKFQSEAEDLSLPPDAVESEIDKKTKGMKKLRRPLTPQERAIAIKLIQSAKNRREVMEWNFHRFRFFEDEAQLPDWFVEDERQNMRKPVPFVQKELTERPVQGKTIRKVEEAKMRKKNRQAKKLKKVRQKVDEMGDDIPEREKWAKIRTLYQKAGLLKEKRRAIHYVVNKKGGNDGKLVPKGAKMRLVDRRMRSDLRGQKRAAERNSKKGKKKTNRRGR